MTLAPHFDIQPAGQRVDDRRADAVKAAGYGISATAELAAGMQHGEDDLNGRLPLALVDVDRDAAAVVDASHGAIGKDRDGDRVAVTRHRLVDGVVDDLLHEVVESARAGRPDVHARTLADGLESLENLDLVGPVIVVDPVG